MFSIQSLSRLCMYLVSIPSPISQLVSLPVPSHLTSLCHEHLSHSISISASSIRVPALYFLSHLSLLLFHHTLLVSHSISIPPSNIHLFSIPSPISLYTCSIPSFLSSPHTCPTFPHLYKHLFHLTFPHAFPTHLYLSISFPKPLQLSSTSFRRFQKA